MIESEDGFITLHRKVLDWEWYSENNTKSLFIHCLLKANYKTKKWRGIEIKRGEFITSIATLSNELHLSTKVIRNSLSKLIETGELGKQTTNKYTTLTVCKYDEYQKKKEDEGKQRASKGQTTGKQGATTNNINKETILLKKDTKVSKKINFLPSDKLEIFNNWLDYRKEIKKEIKNAKTLFALEKRFDKEPIEKIQWVVETSIENQWQGLFWEKFKSVVPLKKERSLTDEILNIK